MSYRNEPARERRRRLLKTDMSLSSLPLEDKRRRLLLENHFGWTVFQKCQVGDGNIPRYPQVVQYHERPDKYGPDYNKLTYVLYLNGKEDTLGKEEKEIQTSHRNVTTAKEVVVIDRPASAKKEEKAKEMKHSKEEKEKPVHRPRDDSLSGRKQAKRKLIDTFYYRERGSSADRIFRPIDSKSKLPESNPVVVANYTTDYVPGNKKPKKEKGRSSPKSWQLRAGADEDSDAAEEVEQESILKTESNLYYSSRGGKFTTTRAKEGEVLWESPSRTNEYLYISRRRAGDRG